MTGVCSRVRQAARTLPSWGRTRSSRRVLASLAELGELVDDDDARPLLRGVGGGGDERGLPVAEHDRGRRNAGGRQVDAARSLGSARALESPCSRAPRRTGSARRTARGTRRRASFCQPVGGRAPRRPCRAWRAPSRAPPPAREAPSRGRRTLAWHPSLWHGTDSIPYRLATTSSICHEWLPVK